MKILVLGAGVIGVTTAYQLSRAGHEVTVVDRCAASGAECSFANGGQLSYSHAEPWANPFVLTKLPKWLLKKDSPLVINPRLDWPMYSWAMRFLACCTSSKSKTSSEHMLRLANYSRQCLQELEEQVDIPYLQTKNGILHTFKTEKSLAMNLKQAEFQKSLGCDFELLDSRQACEEKEPALRHSPVNIAGGIYFKQDSCGGVNEFTVNLSKHLTDIGDVEFKYETNIENIILEKSKIAGVQTNKGLLKADAYVVCLGAPGSVILRNIGIKVPIYPMKGYSISIPISNDDKAPNMGITDQSNKIVYSRLGNVLRVAGTAEFAGYDYSIKPKRIATLKKMTKELFPECGDYDQATQWSCLRPSTPDGSPIIGRTSYDNLFLNTGHGTLGWTMSFASAQAITDIVTGGEAQVDLTGFEVDRF